MQFLSVEGLLDGKLRVRAMALPDAFLDHGKPEAMYAAAGLDADGIVATVFAALGRETLPLAAGVEA